MVSILLLPDATDLALVSIEFDEPTRTIVATACPTTHEACCPLCQRASSNVHSRYVRILADLPCSGQQVRWLVQVRRFRCLNEQCERQIFTERLPTCAPAYARRTVRETEALCEPAFAGGGRAGEPLVRLLGMPISHDTWVRLPRRNPPPEAATPRVLGVDDFAWKRGRRYGTLLIDQMLHTVVDVLPDREAETFAKWLEDHPGVEGMSRDRAGNYADGARRGAPEAMQVCDRFHLLMNLQTALTRLFERKHDTLKRLAEAQEQEPLLPNEPEPAASPASKPPTRTALEAQVRRTRRKERYEHVLPLHEQGASQVAIAALVGLDRDTVRRSIRAPAFPEIVRPRRHKSKLDPYKEYLSQRLQEGQSNSTHLVEALRAQGYQGGSTIVHDYLRSIRKPAAWHQAYQQKKQAGRSAISDPLSARQAAWLFVCNPRKLKLRQVRQLDPLRRLEEELERVYQLTQDFRVMVTQRCSHMLGLWLAEVKSSGIPDLRSLATGIYRDYDAVWAALTTSYSNGQTEAQVHRLKLLKRLAYGRANFDLLRLRLLHGSGVPNQQKCV